MNTIKKVILHNMLSIGLFAAVLIAATGFAVAQRMILSMNNVTSTEVTSETAIISWSTSSASDSRVEYGTVSGEYSNSITNDAQVTVHAVALSDLEPSSTYYYRVGSSKENSEQVNYSGEYSFQTMPKDADAPVISDVQAENISHNQATISWNTDEEATGEVKYGTSATNFDYAHVNNTFKTGHEVIIAGITPETVYYYQIVATDASGNSSQTQVLNFKTETAADNTSPEISNIKVKAVTSQSAEISWQTDEKSSSSVEYGTTTNYGLQKSSSGLVTSHVISVSNLSADTTYHFRVSSSDESGNKAISADMTFKTEVAEGQEEDEEDNEDEENGEEDEEDDQDEDEGVRLDFTLNGTLVNTADAEVEVSVAHASNSIKNAIGTTIKLSITSATVITQDGQQVSGDQLVEGSTINIQGYSQNNVYYANRIEAHQQHFNVTGSIKKIDAAANKITVAVKTATPPLRGYISQELSIKTDADTIIRLNSLYVDLNDLNIGFDANITGTIENSQPLADRIIVLFRR